MDKFEDHDDKKKIATAQPLYKSLPIHFTCPHCDYTGYTIVEQKTTYISYILMILFIFVFGIFFSILLMPLVILLTRSFFHKCPSCFKEVGSDNKILSILNLTDKVISFNIGEFGIVLTRKIVMGIFLSLVLILTVYAKLDFDAHHHHGPMVPTYATWQTFLEDCGREAVQTHGLPKLGECKVKYTGKTVMNWRGYVIRTEDLRNNYFSSHSVLMFVKMVPSESEFFPDLMIAIDSHVAKDINDELIALDRGSEIIFNATIVTFGDDGKTRHFHLMDLKKGQGSMEISELVHDSGRYSDPNKNRLFRPVIILTNQLTDSKTKTDPKVLNIIPNPPEVNNNNGEPKKE